jgi:hypothetical protein
MSRLWLPLLGALLAWSAMADPAPGLHLQAEGQTLNPVCTGQGVLLEGNHNIVKPFGLCRSLVVKGIANQFVLDLTANASLRVEGSGNRVTYRSPTSAVVDLLGTDNIVTAQPASTPVMDTGSVMHLTGDDQTVALDCTGRSVAVDGNRAMYLLRGGCKSLTIHGDLVIVQAELQPGAAVAITGHGVRVGWVLAGTGKPPAASMHGEANHFEHLDAIGGLPAR